MSMKVDINQVAMEVILNASAGRDKVDEVVKLLNQGVVDRVDEMLANAEKLMLKAHQAQTSMIQRQAAGEDTEYSLLFIHAQDTLMTANSELRLVTNLLPLLKKVASL